MGIRRRAAVLAALMVLASGGLAVAGEPAAQAHPGQPGNVFDRNSVSWQSLRDRTPAQFDADLTSRRKDGFIPVDIDADASGGSYRLAAVYQRNTDNRDWAVLHGLTDAAYTQAWGNFASLGLRLADFETYLLDGVRYYNGLWVENVEGYSWSSRRNMDLNAYIDYVNGVRSAGRMLIDLDVYQTAGGSLRYAAASVHNADGLDWIANTGLSVNSFNTLIANTSDTMRPLVATSLETGAGQRYAVILVENANGRDWAERHDLTSADFGLVWGAFAGAGFRLVGYDRYETAAGVRYLGIWRQND